MHDWFWGLLLPYLGRVARECGGAQMWRRRPRPVLSSLGGPERLPCLGTPALGRADTRCRRYGKRLQSPAPGPGATPGPAPVWALWGWAQERLPGAQALNS